MSARFIGFAALVAALVGLFAQGGGQAQDTPAPKAKRALYVVKHADAKELAGVLGKHFKDDADIQAVPSSNVLLVRATPAVVEEVAKLLTELDRRPRLVAVEVIVIEAATKADNKALEEKEFTGTQKAVLEKIEALKKTGTIGEMKRYQFTAVEGIPVTLSIGESKPYTSGLSAGFRAGGKGGAGGVAGPVSRQVAFRDVGAQAKVAARVADNKAVVLDLDFNDSRMHFPKDGVVIGQDENGAPVHMAEFVRTSLKSKLSISAGQIVAAKDVQSTAKSSQARILILATARVVEQDSEK